MTDKPRRGRPRTPERLAMDAAGIGTDWSERTRARYLRSWRLLNALEGREAARAAMVASSRPNGSMNVAKFERLADAALMTWIED